MRIWDIDPGYLNDKSLLGEHRELHAIYTILTEGKHGYSKHPETRRWEDHLSALALRHTLLTDEMILRQFDHRSPLAETATEAVWPALFIDVPAEQFERLKRKYETRSQGRIPLPVNCQDLWAQHKYSVMARSPEIYREMGRAVSQGRIGFSGLAGELVALLRTPPAEGRLINALLHMWGYLSTAGERDPAGESPAALLEIIRGEAMARDISCLRHSTATGELLLWARRLPLRERRRAA